MLHSSLHRNHGAFARCVALLTVVVLTGWMSSESQSQEAGGPMLEVIWQQESFRLPRDEGFSCQ